MQPSQRANYIRNSGEETRLSRIAKFMKEIVLPVLYLYYKCVLSRSLKVPPLLVGALAILAFSFFVSSGPVDMYFAIISEPDWDTILLLFRGHHVVRREIIRAWLIHPPQFYLHLVIKLFDQPFVQPLPYRLVNPHPVCTSLTHQYYVQRL